MAVTAYLRLSCTPESRDRVLPLIQDAVSVVQGQEGFQDLDAYHCPEEREWHLFATWESREHHEACQRSPQWFMLIPAISELMEEEALQFKLTFCEPL